MSRPDGNHSSPGAQVVVKAPDAGDEVPARDGHFSIPNLPQGGYRVSASLTGFATTTATAEVVVERPTSRWICRSKRPAASMSWRRVPWCPAKTSLARTIA